MNAKKHHKKITDADIRKLVIARLRTLSDNRRISIGSGRELTKEELIQRVQKNDTIGKKVIAIQLQYLRSLKEGILFDN